MQRRALVLSSGAALAGALVAHGADIYAAGAYDVSLGVEPSRKADEFLCRVSLRSGESGAVHQADGTFKKGTKATLRTGEGRPDGSAIDLTVDVSVDADGERAEFLARITDRSKVVSVQHTTVALPRS